MGLGLIALIVFLLITIIWTTVLKRDIGESMLISFIVTALFGGSNFLNLIWEGLVFAFTSDIIFAAVAFVFMSVIIEKADITRRLIEILNSILGRLPGSSGYVATIGAALFGMISPSGSANQAAVGSITIPWMVRSGFKKDLAATISAGNSGFGFNFPASIGMFILLGFAPIAEAVSQGQFVTALIIGGVYQLIYRLFLVFYFVKKDKIKPTPMEEIQPLKKSLHTGWKSLLIFIGILVPIMVTLGPLGTWFKSNPSVGNDAVKAISLMIWVPVLILFVSIIVGRDYLPKNKDGWNQFARKTIPLFSELATIIIFAFAISDVLSKLGLAQNLTDFVAQFNLAKWVMIFVIGLLIAVVAGPLSGSATVTMVGLFSYTALISVGVTPLAACVAICAFTSTEGSSPPSSAQIFVAAGMAGSNPVVSFIPLIKYYVIPPVIIGCLVAGGVLPIPY